MVCNRERDRICPICERLRDWVAGLACPTKIPAVTVRAVPALDCRSKRHRLSSVGDCRTGREARGQRKNGKHSDTLSRRCGAACRVGGRLSYRRISCRSVCMGRSRSCACRTVSETPGVAVWKGAARYYCCKIDGGINNGCQRYESKACRKWEWADCSEDVRHRKGLGAVHQCPEVPVGL